MSRLLAVPSLLPLNPSPPLRLSRSEITVRLGEYRLYSAADGPHIDLRPTSTSLHPRYDHASQRHDLGLLTLPYDVTVHTAERDGLKEDIRPICLPPHGEEYAGEDGTVIGEARGEEADVELSGVRGRGRM